MKIFAYGIWNPESRKHLLTESGKYLLMESGILLFETWNLGLGPESRKAEFLESGIHRGGIMNPVPGMRSPHNESGI